MDKVAVDVEQACAIIGFMGDVGIPDFVIERFGGHVVLSRFCVAVKMAWVWARGRDPRGHYRYARMVQVAPKKRQGRRARSSMSKTCVMGVRYTCEPSPARVIHKTPILQASHQLLRKRYWRHLLSSQTLGESYEKGR